MAGHPWRAIGRRHRLTGKPRRDRKAENHCGEAHRDDRWQSRRRRAYGDVSLPGGPPPRRRSPRCSPAIPEVDVGEVHQQEYETHRRHQERSCDFSGVAETVGAFVGGGGGADPSPCPPRGPPPLITQGLILVRTLAGGQYRGLDAGSGIRHARGWFAPVAARHRDIGRIGWTGYRMPASRCHRVAMRCGSRPTPSDSRLRGATRPNAAARAWTTSPTIPNPGRRWARVPRNSENGRRRRWYPYQHPTLEAFSSTTSRTRMGYPSGLSRIHKRPPSLMFFGS